MRAPLGALCLCFATACFLVQVAEARILGGRSGKQLTEEDSDRQLWIEYLSWQPRALLMHNFLSERECDHLVKAAMPHMEKSTVVDNETGQSKLDSVRTSSGTFLLRGGDEVVREVEKRIALHTMLPVEHGEGLQILRYNHGEKYSSHFDFFHDAVNTVNGGQRVATVLMYLSDVEEGGETVFPESSNKPNLGKSEFSACAQAGVAVKPRKGDALFFYSMAPDASLDALSMHGGCPVIQGSKWSATKWLRVGNYNTRRR